MAGSRSSTTTVRAGILLLLCCVTASLLVTASASAARPGSLYWMMQHKATTYGTQWLLGAPGPGGDAYLAGEFGTSKTTAHAYVCRVGPGHTTRWIRRFGSWASGSTAVRSLISDSRGNVVVIGFHDGGTGFMAVAKYQRNGHKVWIRHMKPRVSQRVVDVSTGAVRPDGTVLVTVTATRSGSTDALLVALDGRTGRTLWRMRIIPELAYGVQRAAGGVVCDRGGHAYVSGSLTLAQSSRLFLAKFSRSGDMLWRYSWDAPASLKWGSSHVVFTKGRAFVAAAMSLIGTPATLDAGTPWVRVMSIRASGRAVWTRDATAGRLGTVMTDLVADPDGEVYLTGQCRSASGALRGFMQCWKGNARRSWLRQYRGPTSAQPAVIQDAIVVRDHLFCTGWRYRPDGGTSMMILRVHDSGTTAWMRQWGADQVSDARGHTLVPAGKAGVFVAGTIAARGGVPDAAIWKMAR